MRRGYQEQAEAWTRVKEHWESIGQHHREARRRAQEEELRRRAGGFSREDADRLFAEMFAGVVSEFLRSSRAGAARGAGGADEWQRLAATLLRGAASGGMVRTCRRGRRVVRAERARAHAARRASVSRW